MPLFVDLARPVPLAVLAVLCLTGTWLVIPPLMPLLRRYALARPNARSSHSTSTPQGGGIAVIGVALVALGTMLAATPGIPAPEHTSIAVLAAAALVLAALGGVDDVRPLPALPRLLAQAACVAAVVATLPDGVRLLPGLLPAALERALMLLGLLWYVNLTNFMDGIDWITVAAFVPLAAALAVLAACGATGSAAGLVGAALLGSLLGFAPFNRPVARLFLGDVGSLPLGLLAGYGLIRLAGDGHLVAALLLPLYELADATLTLLRRLATRERVWEAHRSHFYQRATRRGLPVAAVVGRVFVVDVALAGLAGLSVLAGTPALAAAALVAGIVVVGLLLRDLVRERVR